MVTVAVLGHRGYLGAHVARYLREWGADVRTTDLRWDGTPALVDWAAEHEYVIDCIRGHDTDLAPLLATRCRLVIPSTDAIREDTPYAIGKRVMERTVRAVIIRAGIVDTRRRHPVAYTDWLCDPLTPLEWAEAAWAARDEPGVISVGRHPVDRWTIAMHVARVFGREFPRPGSGGRRDRIVAGWGHQWIGHAIEEYARWLLS